MNIKNDPIHYVAIDVSKATLQIQDDGLSMAIANDPGGFKKLLKHLKGCVNPLVVFEASGGYERALMETLHKAAIPLAMVNPARVRDFARSEGVRSKTDPIDAKMILAFAKSKALKPMQAPSEVCLKLAAFLDRRGHLVEQLTREKNRIQNSETLVGIRCSPEGQKQLLGIRAGETKVLLTCRPDESLNIAGLNSQGTVVYVVTNQGKDGICTIGSQG